MDPSLRQEHERDDAGAHHLSTTSSRCALGARRKAMEQGRDARAFGENDPPEKGGRPAGPERRGAFPATHVVVRARRGDDRGLRWCLVTTLIVHSNLTLLICGGADVTAIGAARVSRQQVNGSEMRWDDMIRQGGARSVAQCSPIKSSELTVASKECVQ